MSNPIPVFIISIVNSQRREKMVHLMNQLNWNFEFIDGVVIKTRQDHLNISKELKIKCANMYRAIGDFGCACAHVRCYDIMVRRKLPFVLILEDDIDPNMDGINHFMQNTAQYLDPNKEILFVHPVKIWGTQAQIVSQKGAKKFYQYRDVLLFRRNIDIELMRNPLFNVHFCEPPYTFYLFKHSHNFNDTEQSERLQLNDKPLQNNKTLHHGFRLAKSRPSFLDFAYVCICTALSQSIKTNEKEIPSTHLCKLMKKYGSDKAGLWHNYTETYDEVFYEIKYNKLNIFELGLGTNYTDIPSNMGVSGKPGASLYAWRDYFPNSFIYGADIDDRILFNDERINTFYCDQTNPLIIQNMWNNGLLKNTEFDIIIDDGLHEFNANKTFLVNSMHKLKKTGHYIIEDINNQSKQEWKNYMLLFEKQYPTMKIQLLEIPYYRNRSDNNLIWIHYKL